jgi:hypothetical protein
LIMGRLRAAVPSAPAGRTLVDAVISLIVEVMLGKFCVYISDGTARTPECRPSAPPRCTGDSSGGPKARCGSWHVAQAIMPEADKEASKNSARPTAVIAAAEGGLSKVLE